MGAVGRTVRRTLWEKVPRDHRESTRDLHRRQAVTFIFVVIGAVVLSFSLRIEPGNDWFYPATLGLAVVWTRRRLPLRPAPPRPDPAGRGPRRPPAVADAGRVRRAPRGRVFVVGALVVRQIPALDAQVRHVLDHANEGSVPLLVVITALNGVAEELFFRGALYAATTRYPVVVTTSPTGP